jgi:hypothetical protein
MGAVGKGASEIPARDRRRVQEVVAFGLDPGLDPRHQVEEGPGEPGGGEVAVADAADRPLHQQVALAVGVDPGRVRDLVADWNEEVAQVVKREHRDADVTGNPRNLRQPAFLAGDRR